jgi:hypothetical protein
VGGTGRFGRHATRAVPSSRWEGVQPPPPLPLGEARPLMQEPHVCGRLGLHTARLVRSSGGAGVRPGEARPVPGPHVWAPQPVHYPAGAEQVEGRAYRRSAQGEARPGPEPGAQCVGSSDDTPLGWCRESGWECVQQLSPGPRAAAPRVWALWPIRCSAGPEQRRGGRSAAPHRANLKPCPGRSPTCAGASAYTPLGWC